MRDLTDVERRAFLSEGTRTGKLAWTGPSGRPHVAPIWFVLDGDDVVFNTAKDSAKGRAFVDRPDVSLVVDEEVAPYAFVKLDGRVTLHDDPGERLAVATRIGGRYMGEDRAAEYGARNGQDDEWLVRLRPERIRAVTGVAD